MFPEFGQAPLCLQIDLDSYDGSWTHMAAFRGRGGWVTAARATIQSEHDLMRAVLLAACDDYENPLPGWRAAQLVSCDWSNLSECREMPPDLLDDLLCEEEGAFFARWQRSANTDLARLHDRAQHDLAAIDGQAAAAERRADREIRELQHRRRHPDASPDARAALDQLIAAIEADSDAALSMARERRAVLRRDIDAAEETLWDRSDVLIEVEPMWCVRWEAGSARQSIRRPVSRGGWREAPGGNLAPMELAGERLSRATRAGRVAVAAPRVEAVVPENPPSVRTSEDVGNALQTMRHGLGQVEEQARRATRSGLGVVQAQAAAQHHRDRIATLQREQNARPAEATVPRTIAPNPGSLDGGTRDSDGATLLTGDALAKVRRERLAASRHLEVLELRAGKFRTGSPKFLANRNEQASLRAQIAALDARLGSDALDPVPVRCVPISAAHVSPVAARSSIPLPPPANQLGIAALETERAALALALSTHERRGASKADGSRYLILYRARREEMRARLGRIDAQLAAVRIRLRTTA